MQLDLAKMASEKYVSKEIRERNERAAQYSAEVERRRVEIRSRWCAAAVLVLIIIGCSL